MAFSWRALRLGGDSAARQFSPTSVLASAIASPTSVLASAIASPYVALVFVTLIWGGLHPIGKIAMREATPIQFVLARVLFGCSALGLMLAARGQAGLIVRELRTRTATIALLGSISFFGSSGPSMIALSLLPASVSSLLANTSPLFVALGAIVLSRKRTSPGTIVGIVIGFLGLGLVVFGEDPAGFGNFSLDPRGIGLALFSSLTWAIYIVVGRRALGTSNPIAVVAASGVFGGLPWLVIAAVNGDLVRYAQLSTPTLLLLVGLGVVGTGLTYGLWTAALTRLSAPTVAVFQYAIPFWAVILSVSLLGEPLTLPLVLGGLGIVAGIATTQRSSS
jgi:drug/metabolite transporter (DMT)-like permease